MNIFVLVFACMRLPTVRNPEFHSGWCDSLDYVCLIQPASCEFHSGWYSWFDFGIHMSQTVASRRSGFTGSHFGTTSNLLVNLAGPKISLANKRSWWASFEGNFYENFTEPVKTQAKHKRTSQGYLVHVITYLLIIFTCSLSLCKYNISPA